MRKNSFPNESITREEIRNRVTENGNMIIIQPPSIVLTVRNFSSIHVFLYFFLFFCFKLLTSYMHISAKSIQLCYAVS